MEQTDSSDERDVKTGRRAAEMVLGRHGVETSVIFRVTLKENVYSQRVLYFITCRCLWTRQKMHEDALLGLHSSGVAS